MPGSSGEAPELQECVLCHRLSPDVRMQLLRFEDAGVYWFDADSRCRDRISCREEAERAGYGWPVADTFNPERAGMVRR